MSQIMVACHAHAFVGMIWLTRLEWSFRMIVGELRMATRACAMAPGGFPEKDTGEKQANCQPEFW